jgi:hypothetical protein
MAQQTEVTIMTQNADVIFVGDFDPFDPEAEVGIFL